MSATDSLHYQLCVEGGKWLKRKKYNNTRCPSRPCHQEKFCTVCNTHSVVAVELVTMSCENCDVWGYDGFNSTVIEVKVSHADFVNDQKKRARKVPPEYQMGNLRWYLCPENVIKPDELPEGWGLLYWNGKKIEMIAPPVHRSGCNADLRVLYSIMRREGLTNRIFNYRGAPATIHPKKN